MRHSDARVPTAVTNCQKVVRVRASFSTLILVTSVGPAFADPCEAPLPAYGTMFSGEVTYIVDGDGFCVGRERGGVEVRLADFNACELGERGGDAAKQSLRQIAFGKTVECVAGRRSYDRVVAQCTVDGQNVGALMHRAGACEGGR
jgi:micrococcal nuclease